MKSFAEWSRHRAHLELKAVNEAVLLQEQEAAQAQACGEAAEELQELSLALSDSIALSRQLETASHMTSVAQAMLDQKAADCATHLESRIAELEQVLSGKVAGAVLPLLQDTMRQKAVDDFCLTLRQNIAPGLKADILVQAPQEMQDLLKHGLAKLGLQAGFADAPAAEISAEVSGMVIETTLTEWSQRLQELVRQ